MIHNTTIIVYKKLVLLLAFIVVTLNSVGQSLESIATIKTAQEKTIAVDYLGEGAGASAILGFFFLDIDTDNDGLPDFYETNPGDDLDGDGLINSIDPDDDNDGIIDALDVQPIGVTSMPTTYFVNGAVAAANGNTIGDYWQFLPNKVSSSGAYSGYYEHPGVYLYIDNNANNIPDALEYTTGSNKMPPYTVDKGIATSHITNGSFLGLLGDYNYSGSPSGDAHITGRTIFYICDDDSGTSQTGNYTSNTPYAVSDSYSSVNNEVDYNIYDTTDAQSLNIPKAILGTDAVGIDYFKYRWFDDIIVSPNRELVFFNSVFWSVGGSQVNTFYSKTAFNPDATRTNYSHSGGATTGDNFGGGTKLNWFPDFQNTADHNTLAADVFGAGTTWAMIANSPTDGSPVVALSLANQTWVDTYENWTESTKIVQYRAVNDWFAATAATINNAFNARYSYDLTTDVRNIIIRAKNDRTPHFMVISPTTDPNSFIIGVEDLYGGGDRDFEDEVFYITFNENVTVCATKTDVYTTNQCTGDIAYEVEITNVGVLTATNVVFNDTPDTNTTLQVGSVTSTAGTIVVGNTAGNTSTQVNIGNLATGETVTIKFNVTVNGGVFPTTTTVSNQGTVSGSNFVDVLTSDPDALTHFVATESDLTAVIDNIAPSITCPANQTANFDVNCQYTLLDYTGLATATDNCTALVTVTQSPAIGTIVTTDTTITLTADDGNGNTTDCTFDITITDNIAPSITCPANQTANFDANCQYTLLDYTALATATDNCTAVVTITQSPVVGTIVTTDTTITLTADDGNGNTTDCTFDVIITDNIAPAIICPANQTGNFDVNCQYTLLDYTALATATDNCTAAVMVTQSPVVGTIVTTDTTITLTADDGNGNTTDCTFDVTITDNITPAITCPANQTANFDANCQYTLLDYTALATATDNCTAVITVTQSPIAGTIVTADTTITLTADDGNGNTTDCTFDVTITDNIAPAITCPSNQTANFDTNCQYTLLDYTALATATDNCTAVVTVTQSPAIGTVVTADTTITLTADDGNGNTTDCTFDVIITDNIAPSITCPANQTVNFDANCQYTLLDYTALATATDNCTAVVTITQSPVAGTIVTTDTTITLTADDGNGNTTDCTFDVTITDNIAPSIICPANQSVNFDANCQYTLLDYTALTTATDNCTAAVTVTQSPAIGTVVTGDTTITLTADDGNGNTTDCTFDVTITDNIAPSIICPTNQTVNFDANCQYTLLDYTALAIATDNCTAVVTITQSPVAGTIVTTDTTITLTADDGNGNTTDCTFDITITDNIAPAITCPANQAVNFDANCQYTLLDYTALATATDNCTAVVTVTQSPAVGTIVTTDTTITLTADDGNGNTTDCTFDITITDNIPPAITCPANQEVNFDANCQYTLLDYTALTTATDNCTAAVMITQSPAVGTIVTADTTITLTADDGNGNTTDCTFDVIITDNIPPAITCPANQTANFDTNCQYTLLDYTGLATATDNCNPSIMITQSPAVGTIVTTDTTITLTADDGHGNTTDCTFDVIITDNIAPSITCPVNQTANFDTNCQYTLLDYTALATATDNCTAAVTVTQSPVAGTIVTTDTTITLTADDGNGNTTDCTFDVMITDNIAPAITCPVNQTANFDANCQYILLDYTALAIGTDNCTAVVTVTQSPAVGTIVTADTTITLTADDGNGNTTDCTFDITITDNIPPAITCPANQAVNFDANCQYTLLDYTALAIATDNCNPSVIITQSPAIGTVVTTDTTITLTADDGNGNTTNCTFDVTITDNIPPAITCPSNQTANFDANCQYTLLDYTALATATDSCTAVVMITQSPAVGTIVTADTTITLTADDGNGNTTDCTFDVMITDNIAPIETVAALPDVVNFCKVENINPSTAMDNCDGLIIGVTAESFPIITSTTITWEYIDSSGNVTTQNQKVIVTDNNPPIPDVVALETLNIPCILNSLTPPTATDDCRGSITATTTTSFPISSSTQIAWVFSDGINEVTQYQQINIIDSTPINYRISGNTNTSGNRASVTVTIKGSEHVNYSAYLENTSGWKLMNNDKGSFSVVFENVEVPDNGLKVIRLRSEDGCWQETINVYLLRYNEFFTPNNDGVNDTWNIFGLANIDPNAKIEIFDRFGKLINKVTPADIGWDGSYNGALMPGNDYWFKVDYKESDSEGNQFLRNASGHFSLLRR
ncbi:T9SS type B sorting domain-containing protein [Tenacibaculum ovolyticum]|uniref:T9SS type B sorting domain-containing protein n=2 Tax=Tenacibaculum ovolyticum TaxID=104270 RepID=UPI0007EC5A7D|nr:T9SS type B sorting domain-containing protein [Tenacibaculum ovolyticum]